MTGRKKCKTCSVYAAQENSNICPSCRGVIDYMVQSAKDMGISLSDYLRWTTTF